MKRPLRFFTMLLKLFLGSLGHISDLSAACIANRCFRKANVKAILASSRVRGRAAARIIWRRIFVCVWFLLRLKILSYALDTWKGRLDNRVSMSDSLPYSLGLCSIISKVRWSQSYGRCCMLFRRLEILRRSLLAKRPAMLFTLASMIRSIS
jgi:hypothetical protein